MNFDVSDEQIHLQAAIAKACMGDLAWGNASSARALTIYQELGLLSLFDMGLGMTDVMLMAQTLGREARGLTWVTRSIEPLRGEDGANAALCALVTGAMSQLLDLTREHLKTRQQFGQPLSKFQALQHRLADMLIDLEQAKAMSCLAAAACDENPSAQQAHYVSAAKVIVSQAARRVAYGAIQLHGATGMTDARIGALVRLIVKAEKRFGDVHHHLSRIERLQIKEPV
jgi:alkylation response protein AidB-like acyl-CoA dehydrogenase